MSYILSTLKILYSSQFVVVFAIIAAALAAPAEPEVESKQIDKRATIVTSYSALPATSAVYTAGTPLAYAAYPGAYKASPVVSAYSALPASYSYTGAVYPGYAGYPYVQYV